MYRTCVYKEVYALSGKKKLNFIEKLRWKYFSISGNAVYLIRRMQYYYSTGKLGRLYALYLRGKLARRYGIIINPGCTIGIGLRIPHPTSIVITNAEIGNNFTIYQGCTIGQKGKGSWSVPQLGNNIIMFANSSIVGG